MHNVGLVRDSRIVALETTHRVHSPSQDRDCRETEQTRTNKGGDIAHRAKGRGEGGMVEEGVDVVPGVSF